MAKKREVRVVFCRPKALMILVIAAVLVLSTAVLLTLDRAIDSTRAATEELRPQAYALEQENSRLQQYINELGTIQGLLRIAQEKLGLVEPDTVIFETETTN